MITHRRILVTAIIVLLISGVLATVYPLAGFAADAHPEKWAQPLDREGLPNLHQVTPLLYRGAQPTAGGMQQLKAMGIKTVINLRSFNSDREELGTTGLAYEHIPMKAWHPEQEDIIRFLRITTGKTRLPVFVHCQHGADRTGLMCAIYRVVIQGWTKEEAIQEMTQGGFGHHAIWTNLVRFIQDLDIEGIKKQAGIPTRGAP
jgi:protein tyrosine/serine phosphatase